MSIKRIQIEVCIESVEDALTAERSGAGRVELCSALSMGGLTPSLATLEAARRAVKLPIMTLIRPRPGGFCYSDAEFAVLLREIELCIEFGADGIVTGVLTESGEVDRARCRDVLKASAGKPVVFHRAFDFAPDPLAALEALTGFIRILTSGQQGHAMEGAELIRKLRERSAGQIEILPGGGINADNVVNLLTLTGCDQIHASARKMRLDPSLQCRPDLRLSSTGASEPNKHGYTDEARLADLVAAVRTFEATQVKSS